MAENVTAFGLQVRIIAVPTFPAGVTITQFADDADPLDLASVQIGDSAMGLNGDLIRWAKAVSIPMVLNVIPGSADDRNLQILADNNRVGAGKIITYDNIRAVVIYPNGNTVTLTGGIITDAMFGNSASSAGRLKTKTYAFRFQDKIGAF